VNGVRKEECDKKMKKQRIDFELDFELSKSAVDDIFQILSDEGAENIVHDWVK
jgi:ribosome-associated toxin RatA of RatAB toxin-antitoxin module